ncbi:MAG: DUF504 domain-containing protein [Methanobacteriota archaeon]
MPSPREVLNKLKWTRAGRGDVLVFYVHRGAPGDFLAVRGEDVEALERGFLVLLGGTRIPYHRVFRIERGGEVVYERVKRDK